MCIKAVSVRVGPPHHLPLGFVCGEGVVVWAKLSERHDPDGERQEGLWSCGVGEGARCGEAGRGAARQGGGSDGRCQWLLPARFLLLPTGTLHRAQLQWPVAPLPSWAPLQMCRGSRPDGSTQEEPAFTRGGSGPSCCALGAPGLSVAAASASWPGSGF